jgi:hypothetical protein
MKLTKAGYGGSGADLSCRISESEAQSAKYEGNRNFKHQTSNEEGVYHQLSTYRINSIAFLT